MVTTCVAMQVGGISGGGLEHRTASFRPDRDKENCPEGLGQGVEAPMEDITMLQNELVRVIIGLFQILLGIGLVVIYLRRDIPGVCGKLYRALAQLMGWQGNGLFSGRILVVLGCVSILGGVIGILFGFKSGHPSW